MLAGLLSACGDGQVVAPGTAAESASEEITYDPATCKTDAQGMVYFALGREVFRKPAEPGVRMRPILNTSPETLATLPPSPDPNEPKGCPDNPVRGTTYGINYQHQPREPGAYPVGTSFEAKLLGFVEITRDDWNSTVDVVKWGTQSVDETAFERVRDNYNACEVLANGLTVCRVPWPDKNILSWPTKFQAVSPVYDTPFGRPFTVSCNPALPGLGPLECHVSYNYTENTRVIYFFELRNLPAMEIIEFDKGLRAAIEAMRVPAYRWPDESQN
jgi:hypothetical protein